MKRDDDNDDEKNLPFISAPNPSSLLLQAPPRDLSYLDKKFEKSATERRLNYSRARPQTSSLHRTASTRMDKGVGRPKSNAHSSRILMRTEGT
jgi:hypothetical protein